MGALEGDSSESNSEKERRGIQSIEAGGQLLLALGAQGRPMPLRELAKAADMAPGKAHPYLVSFSKLGLVTQEASTGYYWLGPTAMQLGLVTLRMLNPVREATPFAEQLARKPDTALPFPCGATKGRRSCISLMRSIRYTPISERGQSCRWRAQRRAACSPPTCPRS